MLSTLINVQCICLVKGDMDRVLRSSALIPFSMIHIKVRFQNEQLAIDPGMILKLKAHRVEAAKSMTLL